MEKTLTDFSLESDIDLIKIDQTSMNTKIVSYYKNERIAILGAGRGLGYSIAHHLISQIENIPLWLSSRKIISKFETHPNYSPTNKDFVLFPMDYTKPLAVDKIVESLCLFMPTKIIYCAGGGPFGPFQEKSWSSHLWAIQLNFLFPGEFLHQLLKIRSTNIPSLKQIIFVGSSIAEDKADPGASSYSASKHGLRGLVRSIVCENQSEQPLDIRLYSPGYMNTELLTPNSRPRRDGSKIAEPQKIADDLLHWAMTPANPNDWHRIP